jgi:hypothetical protein
VDFHSTTNHLSRLANPYLSRMRPSPRATEVRADDLIVSFVRWNLA